MPVASRTLETVFSKLMSVPTWAPLATPSVWLTARPKTISLLVLNTGASAIVAMNLLDLRSLMIQSAISLVKAINQIHVEEVGHSPSSARMARLA